MIGRLESGARLADLTHSRQYSAMTQSSWAGRNSITFGEISKATAEQHQSPIRWHYTTASTLPLILENHALWATSVDFLNDTDEIKLGIKRIKRYISDQDKGFMSPKDRHSQPDMTDVRELIEEWEHFPYLASAFTTSFSRDGDDNSQWDRYAKRDGFAIGIREGSHMPILGDEPDGGTTRSNVVDAPLRWASMVYARRKQTALIQHALDNMHDGMMRNAHPEADVDMSSIIRDQAISDYVMAAARIKNRGFRSEREVRYVVSRPQNAAAIHTRSGPHGPATTYVKLTGAPDGAVDVSHLGDLPLYQSPAFRLPIVKVRLGPDRKESTEVAKVEQLLADNGYHGVKVVRSRSTQR